MSVPFSSATLAGLAGRHLDADPGSLRVRPIATGKHNASFWIDSPGGRYVLRVAPPDDAGFLFYERLMMRQEPGLHALLRARTTIPAADIVAYDFSRELMERDYLLMTALPGTPLSDVSGFTGVELDRALGQVGEYLAQLHRLNARACLGRAAYGYLGAHAPMEPQPDWAAAFRVMWNKLLDDVTACGAYTADEAGRFRDLLDRHLGHFQRHVSPRLLHMDVWSQNILVDGSGNVTGLVDFDRALWGDREIEFAVLDYCGISMPAFWEGYAAAGGGRRDTSPSAMIRRQFYLLYEVQKYMPIRIWRRRDPQGAAAYKRQCLALASELMGTK